jgi:formylglycine-generating enzyme required for sulfatase activity
MKKALLIVSVAVFGLSFGGGEGTKDKTVPAVDTAATVAAATDTAAAAPDTDDDINESETPYEATWMELEGDVVYNYLDWDYTPDTDDEKYRTPTIIRVRGNRLIYKYYHEAEMTYLFDSVERKDNGVYFFQIIGGEYSFLIDSLGFTKYSGGKYSFQWVDKKKHTAKWIYYNKGGRVSESNIYIDSAYNKYPIVKHEWLMRKCWNYEVEMATPSPPDASSNPDSIAMVFVEGGTFTMGCTAEQGRDCDDREKPAREVTVNSFYLAKYETTQGLWASVTGAFPRLVDSAWGLGSNFPIYYVSWVDIQPFIEMLNAKTGKNYRLPTEAEWEYAARGGNKSKGYKYSGSNNINKVAWYDDLNVYNGSGFLQDGGCTARPVGIKQANELGLYDMSGNVAEVTNTQTAIGKDNWHDVNRVIRGGDYMDPAKYCRVSSRYWNAPDFKLTNIGFRLARDP